MGNTYIQTAKEGKKTNLKVIQLYFCLHWQTLSPEPNFSKVALNPRLTWALCPRQTYSSEFQQES